MHDVLGIGNKKCQKNFCYFELLQAAYGHDTSTQKTINFTKRQREQSLKY
jgi:hypothetical protein